MSVIYRDLESTDYRTVGIKGDTVENHDLPVDHPCNVAPSVFTFTRIRGGDGNDQVVKLQVNDFSKTQFDAIPPENVLVALIKHYEGLQKSSVKCREFDSVILQLKDVLGILKMRNDLRYHNDVYGTVKPTIG